MPLFVGRWNNENPRVKEFFKATPIATAHTEQSRIQKGLAEKNPPGI